MGHAKFNQNIFILESITSFKQIRLKCMQTLTVESAYEMFSHSNIKLLLNLEGQLRPGNVAFVTDYTKCQ